jgi:monofunctional biosynthetic peptidoglycan transglycosylase
VKSAWHSMSRVFALVAVSALALQLYFALRVALMIVIAPQSTTFQRSEAWRLLTQQHHVPWSQQWVSDGRISAQLKRAVIASEDAGFAEHAGVEWDAIEKAWERNQRAQQRIDRMVVQPDRRNGRAEQMAPIARARGEPKMVGGSTITQQLAKNLFLGPERNLPRKVQEFVITLMLEALLSKRRILEIYLNNVEWGEGLYGAEAAAQHYFRIPASQLGAMQAAQLAVMLPAPKRFEKRPFSAYVVGRAGMIVGRMGTVELP